MFQMDRISNNISRLRKEANLTQMELADKLGISFQAVSNWERGLSMPDISKLNELSEILGVSIDKILDNERAVELIKEISSGSDVPAMTAVEVEGIAPILKPEQVDRVVEGSSELSIREIASVAPFVSTEMLERVTRKHIANGKSLNDLAAILPFLGKNLVDEMARLVISSGGKLKDLACAGPFISKTYLDEITREHVIANNSAHGIAGIAPFLSKEVLGECADIIYRASGHLDGLAPIAPFISKNKLNDLAKEALEKHGLRAISSIAPFISKSVLEQYIIERT